MKTKIIFMLLAVFAGVSVNAQNRKTSTDDFKYEIALDITPFFSDMYLWEGHFKVFNTQKNTCTGAYRVGLFNSNYNLLTFPDDKERGKNHNMNLGLSLGYEKYIEMRNARFYFGADLGGYLSLQKHVPATSNNYRIQTYELTPFIGVRQQIIDCLAATFEIGWRNSVDFDKDLDPKIISNKSVSYASKIDIPYALTINYRF